MDLPNVVLTEHQEALLSQIAHEANRVYCESIGDWSQAPWVEAPDWQQDSARDGVRGVLLEGRTPRESHDGWLAHKKAHGWVYGEVKDPEKKTHPCMVPYDDLPPEQKVKDALFVSVVRSAAAALGITK